MNSILTKTQVEVLKVFTSRIRKNFSIRQVSKAVGQNYSIVYSSVQDLAKSGFLVKDEQGFFSLNYRKNFSVLAYIESLRAEEFLKKNKTCALFVLDVLDRLKEDFFILLFFGSVVRGSKDPQDIDVLVVVDTSEKVEPTEKQLFSITSLSPKEFDIGVIGVESVYEMFSKREEINVLNETLDNHILIFGEKSYYRMLSKARK